MDMIFNIGIFTSLFFSILLFSKKNRSLPDGILAVWMLVIGVHLASYYIYTKGYWEIYPHLIGITVPFPFFYGPLLYLYVSYSVKNRRQLNRMDYLHFLPIVLTYLYMVKFYFFYTTEEKRMVDKGLIDDFSTFSNIIVIAMILSAIVYAIISYRRLIHYRSLIEHNFSNPERINLNWLMSFIWGVSVVFITAALVLVARDVLEVDFPFNPEFIFYSMIVLGILALGYFGIRHENIFTDNVVIEIDERTKLAYEKSNLKADLAADKHAALVRHMREKKPYLEPNLTLNSLASRLDISLHHLSQIINQFEGQNFNDFVNKYRVEEFIVRATKDKHFSFFALALDSGFNSKSTFNAAFKKLKGMPPSKFISSLSKRAA